jgi:hypothetical protein
VLSTSEIINAGFSKVSVSGYEAFAEKGDKINKNSYAENFVLTTVHAQHMGSRWYTSDFDVIAIDNEALVPS